MGSPLLTVKVLVLAPEKSFGPPLTMYKAKRKFREPSDLEELAKRNRKQAQACCGYMCIVHTVVYAETNIHIYFLNI